jgi:hypothetical protein
VVNAGRLIKEEPVETSVKLPSVVTEHFHGLTQSFRGILGYELETDSDHLLLNPCQLTIQDHFLSHFC